MQWNGDLIRKDGSNALLLAIKNDFPQSVVAKIAQRTKNKNIINKFNENTLQLAKAKNMQEIVELILKE